MSHVTVENYLAQRLEEVGFEDTPQFQATSISLDVATGIIGLAKEERLPKLRQRPISGNQIRISPCRTVPVTGTDFIQPWRSFDG